MVVTGGRGRSWKGSAAARSAPCAAAGESKQASSCGPARLSCAPSCNRGSNCCSTSPSARPSARPNTSRTRPAPTVAVTGAATAAALLHSRHTYSVFLVWLPKTAVVLGAVDSGGVAAVAAVVLGGLEGARGVARGCLRALRGGRAPSVAGAGGGCGTSRSAPLSMAGGGPSWCCCSGWPSRRTSGSKGMPRECRYRAAMAATVEGGWFTAAGVRDPLRLPPPRWRCCWCCCCPSSPPDAPRLPIAD